MRWCFPITEAHYNVSTLEEIKPSVPKTGTSIDIFRHHLCYFREVFQPTRRLQDTPQIRLRLTHVYRSYYLLSYQLHPLIDIKLQLTDRFPRQTPSISGRQTTLNSSCYFFRVRISDTS